MSPVRFDPFTGAELSSSSSLSDAPAARPLHPAAVAGLDVPRFCQHCGRKLVVKINPYGWEATCSRHGSVADSITGVPKASTPSSPPPTGRP